MVRYLYIFIIVFICSNYVISEDITKVNNMMLKSVKVTATVYNAVAAQTDSTPHITADGTDIRIINIKKNRIISVSKNLLKRFGGSLSFGDSVYITGTGKYDGYWVVRDMMGTKKVNRVDFLVPNHINTGLWRDITMYIGNNHEIEFQ